MKTGENMLAVVVLVFLTSVQLALSISVQNFQFSPFQRIKLDSAAVSPQLSKLEKMEVAPINSNVKTNMNLIEFLFLNMDFNFEDTVPKSGKLTFKLPDI